jgi:hypothetical protein
MANPTKYHHEMNSALDRELSEQEWAALNAHLEDSPETASYWEQLRHTDHLLRTTPLAAPSPGFTSRVMAAVAAMHLGEIAKHRLGVGVALGLIVAALFTVPVLSILTILLFSTLTDPGTLNALFQNVAGGVGYGLGIAFDLGDGLERLATETPVVPALLTTVIPLSMLWVWLVWYLSEGRMVASERHVI